VIISDVRALPSGRARSCGRVAVPVRAELQLRLISSSDFVVSVQLIDVLFSRHIYQLITVIQTQSESSVQTV
ncbi:hypothetical protein QYM36_008461, partial [Artemia franciscana]